MIKSRWFYHPLFIFIFSLVALITSLFIYIRSYLKVHDAFNAVVLKYNINANQFLQTETWVVILVLSLLVAIILLGLFMIYIYYQKMIQLYWLQQNFINGFTHELKTPIASLQLFLETFIRHELGREDQLKYLEFMKRDTTRLSDNVSRILHLAKLEDKNFKANFQYLDLVEVIENFLQNTPHLFDEGKIYFQYAINGEFEDYQMNLDRSLFEMLLMNLITNAIIYNKATQKTIMIQLSKKKRKVVLSIKDNGIGIDSSEIQKIFKKFYQVGRSSKGSGLGLFIVQSIVKIHRGDIFANSLGRQSQKNGGTTFTMEFPV
jgi:two-component system phosphate regulon sensor histidine kinase PhoR